MRCKEPDCRAQAAHCSLYCMEHQPPGPGERHEITRPEILRADPTAGSKFEEWRDEVPRSKHI
jgi:hypothetical protein